MTPSERYDTKRENFKSKSLLLFRFLIDKLDYELKEHKESKQDNGVIISDEIIYVNKILDRQISIYNAYHPIDYGFEINLYKLSNNDKQMVYYVLKENQDLEQTYLETASDLLASKYVDYISGTKWFPIT